MRDSSHQYDLPVLVSLSLGGMVAPTTFLYRALQYLQVLYRFTKKIKCDDSLTAEAIMTTYKLHFVLDEACSMGTVSGDITTRSTWLGIAWHGIA